MVPLTCHLEINAPVQFVILKVEILDDSTLIKVLLLIIPFAKIKLLFENRVAPEEASADTLLPCEQCLESHVGQSLSLQVVINTELVVHLQNSQVKALFLEQLAFVPGAVLLAATYFDEATTAGL